MIATGSKPSKSVPTFLFILRPRPPRPTLFPYTTLFRSHRGLSALFMHRATRAPIPWHIRCRHHAVGSRAPDRADDDKGSDRKSTRLNSSHGYISYAVFCLKKKTTSDSSTSVTLSYSARL